MRKLFNDTIRSMPRQSLGATRLAFALRSQANIIMLLLGIFVAQIAGVIIFSQTATAVGGIVYGRKIESERARTNDKIVVDASGNVYVPDDTNHVIRTYNSSGVLLRQWGSHGSGDGQFGDASPRRLDVDSSGNVYVVDNGNDRVEKFDKNGNYLAQWGSYGSGDGEFNFFGGSYPGGIGVDSSGNVYVADGYNARVQKFGSDGTYITQWANGSDGVVDMWDLVVNDSDTIYVSDAAVNPPSQDGHIISFDTSGNQIDTISSSDTTFFPSLGIDPTSGDIYASTGQELLHYSSSLSPLTGKSLTCPGLFSGIDFDSSGNHYNWDCDASDPYNHLKLIKFDTGDTPLLAFADPVSGVLTDPSDVAVASTGATYAVTGDKRIVKYRADGRPQLIWGEEGSGDGQFTHPNYIAVDAAGNVYVTDSSNKNVQKFDANGNFITKWGTSGTGNGQFNYTMGIAIDSQNNVYVSDFTNASIQKFTSTGSFVTKWGTAGSGDGQFSGPQGLAVDSQDNVYVVDAYNRRVQKFSSTGTYITKWGSNGTGDGQFSLPYDVAVSANDEVYVSDSLDSRIQKFDASGTYITQWGSNGTGDGQFNFQTGLNEKLGGLAMSANNQIYVADAENDRIQVFNDNSFHIGIDTKTASQITTTTAKVWGQSTDLADLAGATYSIEYGPTTSYGSSTASYSDYTTKVGQTNLAAVDPPGTINVANSGGALDKQGNFYTYKASFPSVCKVAEFDPAGALLHEIGNSCGGNSPTDFSWSTGKFAFDSNNNVFVIDDVNTHFVKEYAADGSYLGAIDLGGGTIDTAPANVYPQSIAIDAADNLFVGACDGDTTCSSSGTPIIKKYDNNGVFQNQWGSRGTGDGQFDTGIAALATDRAGNVYGLSSGFGTARVQKFDNDGNYLSQWSVGIIAGTAMAIDDYDVVYIPTGFSSTTVTMYDTDGNQLDTISLSAAQTGSSSIAGVDNSTGLAHIVETSSSGVIADYTRAAYTNLTGLTCGTTYHYRAVATVGSDAAYGADSTFTTSACLAITTTSLPNGVVGTAYNQTVEANRSNMDFTVSAGSLPDGLSMGTDGNITGTPTTAGTYNFTVQAADPGNSDTDTQDLQIVVTEAPPDPFAITTTTLPNGKVGVTYTTTTIQTDSSNPITFTKQSGTIPPGLTLSGAGVISGTPTTANTYSFTVLASDGYNTDTQNYTVTISPADVTTPTTPTEPPTDPTPPTEPPVTPTEPPTTTTTIPFVPTTPAPQPSPISATSSLGLTQNSLLALVKEIPEPLAFGFPWFLLLLALILVLSQYYQVHAEKQATQQMQTALARQEDLMQEQNNFVALTTHYLHTPLTVMEGELTLMQKKGTITAAQATKLKADLAALSGEVERALAEEKKEGSL